MRYTLHMTGKSFHNDKITPLIEFLWDISSKATSFPNWLEYEQPCIFDNKKGYKIWKKNNDNLITHK